MHSAPKALRQRPRASSADRTATLSIKLPLSATVAILVTLILLGCKGSERAPAHPIFDVYNRNSRKIELVELIIQDPARARKVRSIYEQIATLSEQLAAERLQLTQKAAQAMKNETLTDEELKAQLLTIHAAGSLAYQKYTNLQLELRCHVSEPEFARLAKVL